MIMTALAIFGALLVAVTYRALWIGVRTAQGSRRPPEEWLKRNGFVWRDDGRWHRGRLTVFKDLLGSPGDPGYMEVHTIFTKMAEPNSKIFTNQDLADTFKGDR